MIRMKFSKQMNKILLVLRKNLDGLPESKIIVKGENLDNERKNDRVKFLKSTYRMSIKKLVSRDLIAKDKGKYKLTGKGIDIAQKIHEEVKEFIREYGHLV
ncbi:MAG: hypothetical protein ACE5K4_04375, partial [Candidatus Hydrothermarchaeota archaeon]